MLSCRAIHSLISRVSRALAALMMLSSAAPVGALAEPAAPQTANTYVVDGAIDSIGACSSGLGAYHCPSLRSAVIAANSHAGGDTVVLAHGVVYSLTIAPSGANDATNGDLNITDDIDFTYGNVICFSNCIATLRGGVNWNDRILNVASGAHASLFAVNIQNGAASLGGGIWNAGALVLDNVTVTNNLGSAGCGGISNQPNAILTLNNSQVTYNHATSGLNAVSTGGICNSGTLILTDTLVASNDAAGDNGGINNQGTMTMTGGAIRNNLVLPPDFEPTYSGSAGGLRSSGALVMSGTLVSANNGNYLAGGLRIAFGTAQLTGITVSQNSGGQYGYSGLLIDSGARVTIDRSAIVNNTSLNLPVGGIGSSGALTITNSTISGNTASSGAGLRADSGVIFLNNVTIANNTGGGVAVLAPGTLKAVNTLIAANPGGDCAGGLVSLGYNLIQSGNGCVITGTALLGVDPLLGPLQENGGATLTHAPQVGSPVIDAGNPAAPGSSAIACAPTDQRGALRPMDGNSDGVARCDIGAFEAPGHTFLPFVLRG